MACVRTLAECVELAFYFLQEGSRLLERSGKIRFESHQGITVCFLLCINLTQLRQPNEEEKFISTNIRLLPQKTAQINKFHHFNQFVGKSWLR